jgi:hypothetical protein
MNGRNEGKSRKNLYRLAKADNLLRDKTERNVLRGYKRQMSPNTREIYNERRNTFAKRLGEVVEEGLEEVVGVLLLGLLHRLGVALGPLSIAQAEVLRSKRSIK